MRRRPRDADGDLLAGTLDMLVLRTLAAGPLHGFGIALAIATRSGDVIWSRKGRCTPPCTGSRIAAGFPPRGASPATTGGHGSTR